MTIISYNVNGIRSALNKGFLDWLKTKPADIICLQEIKANEEDMDSKLFEALGYSFYSLSAEKKGYSGVAILTLEKPQQITKGVEAIKLSTSEGRMLIAEFRDFTLVNTYFPSGTTGDIRQDLKYIFLDEYQKWINTFKKKHTQLVCVGDYNIAHEEIDIHNPVSNKNSSGFLPEERAWMTKHLQSGFIDSFRYLNKEKKDAYSWWSFRANARANNKGWRIDYALVSEELSKQLSKAFILNQVKHSDHCPIGIDIF